MLAEEIAQLDLQSAGRIDVGVGRGTEPAALRALQIDADSTRERFTQSCRILVEALSGRPIVAGEGAGGFEGPPAPPSTLPRPPPPLYVAGPPAETPGLSPGPKLPPLPGPGPPPGTALGGPEAAAPGRG